MAKIDNKRAFILILTIILATLLILGVYYINNKREKIKLLDFIGNYEVGLGPDGYYNIEITYEGDKLNFNWEYQAFDATKDVFEVKEYKLKDNKLIVNTGEEEHIIFKSNDKIYLTYEDVEDITWLPSEMKRR